MTHAFGGTPTLTIAPLPPEAPPAPEAKPAKRPTIKAKPEAPLVEDIAALTERLGKSLGVPTTNGYDPDTFVRAVSTAHNTLMAVRKDLGEWQDKLDAREAAIMRREAAVQAREQEAEALATLAGLLPAGGPSRAPQSTVAKWVRRWLGL